MHKRYREYVEELLQRRAGQRDRCFVFPSEVTAEAMERAVLRSGELQALRRDRFISWDRFKEALFSPRRRRRPASSVFRSLFTARLLREHAEEGPLFGALLGGEHTAGVARFRGYLNTVLPTLKGLVDALDGGEGADGAEGPAGGETAAGGGGGGPAGPAGEGLAGAAFPPQLAADFRLLYERYSAFLEQHGLYEPSFESPRRGEVAELHYELFYPELIEDFREYAPLLAGHPQVTVHPMDAPPEGQGEGAAGLDVPLYRYDNAAEELEALLDGVEELLEGGTSPLDIAVTLPDFDGWRSRLEEAAALRQIPLSFRSGRPLSELAAGRFFRRLGELHRSGYDHGRMKELFLDPAYPWRDRGMLRRLIGFGVEHYCLRAYEGREGHRDPWQESLTSPAGAGMQEERRWLNRFRSYLRSMTGSGSAGELLGRVTPFLRLFLDPEGWDPEEERALQFALMVLRELAEAEEHCETAAPNPFALWLSLLEEQSYVHVERSSAVQVYRYRVSAGIVPRCHFIAGAGQQETRCRQIPFPYLRDDRRALLGGEEADASFAFLRAYAASGERVRFSCSNTGFSGPQLPPAEFYTRGLIEAAERDPVAAGDRFGAERRFWSREGRLPGRLYRVQREGWARMRAAGSSRKESDYTVMRIEDGALRTVLRRRLQPEEQDELLRLSPTRIEQMKGCPFVYFIEQGLGLEEEDREPPFVDYRVLGNLYHHIFAELLQRVSQEDGAFRADHIEAYGRWAEESVRRQFDMMERRGEAFMPPVWRRERERAIEKLRRYLQEEAAAFDGYRLVETETDYAAEIPDSGVALTGRIDRRSVQGEESAVVDYKTGGLPRKADTAPPGEEPPIVQLPVYVHLLEQAGREVSSASYYSVKENRFRHVYTERAEHGKGWMSREYLDDAIASIRHTAVRCAQLINAGDLRVPEECEPCDYRGLCRAVFRIAGSPARAPGSPADSGGGGRDVQGRETQGRGAQERNTRGKNDKEGRRGDA